jgi:hypothetical protein
MDQHELESEKAEGQQQQVGKEDVPVVLHFDSAHHVRGIEHPEYTEAADAAGEQRALRK